MSVKDGVAEDVGTVGTLIGDPKFEDINGDGQITPDDRTIIARAQQTFLWYLQQILLQEFIIRNYGFV